MNTCIYGCHWQLRAKAHNLKLIAGDIRSCLGWYDVLWPEFPFNLTCVVSQFQVSERPCGPNQAVRVQSKRVALIPPADHHAERLASGQQCSSRDRQPHAGSKRLRRQSDAASSDSDLDPPRRQRRVGPVPAAADAHAVPSAETSLFSPSISMSGGKAAAELPARRRTSRNNRAAAAHAAADDGRGSLARRSATPEPTPAAASAPATPARSSALPQAATDAQGLRPPVCSPAKAGTKRASANCGAKRGLSAPARAVEQAGAPSDDENANSENDTQIRLSAGPSAQLDPLVRPLAAAPAAMSLPLDTALWLNALEWTVTDLCTLLGTCFEPLFAARTISLALGLLNLH